MKNLVFEYRKKNNFTQEYVARTIDISLSQIRNIEQNRTSDPGVSIALKLAKLFNVSVEDLFFL